MSREFNTTARSLSRNPLGMIALFIVLVYSLASLVIIVGSSLSPIERLPILYFLVIFPVIVLAVFTYLVAFRSGQLFAPSDFQQDETYLELQRMRFTAVASLAVAKQTKDQSTINEIEIADVVRSVERAVDLVQKGTGNPRVLWVDDRPSNNTFERQALEAVGVRFVLAETTKDALDILANQSFGAIISDMGRREGPREGYVLLNTARARGDATPFFFFARSNAPEHKRETSEHGGQGCTNDGQELFEMVTRVIFGTQPTENNSFNAQKQRPLPQFPRLYAVDLALCIDATSSMSPIIGLIKAHALRTMLSCRWLASRSKSAVCVFA
jgi:CheY-like chemotaxis protein